MRFKILFLLFILINSSLYSQSSITKDLSNKSVLLLNSYHKGFRWTDDITHEVIKGLSPYGIELHIEFMDSKRGWDREYQLKLADLLKYKVGRHNYDLILTSDDNAFNFVIENRAEIFNNKPIIFCGVNNLLADKASKYRDITGINEEIDVIGSLDLIKKLHPKIEKISIITDNTTTGQRLQKGINEVIPLYPELSIKLDYNLTGDELINLVESSGKDTVILFTLFYTDKNNVYYENILSEMYKVSINPIYGTWDFNLNNGIIGGVLVSGSSQGEFVAQKALEILGGKDINSIPIEYRTPTKTILDYNLLNRYGMDLPQNSQIELINKPDTFYNKYGYIINIIITIVVILLLSLLIISYAFLKSKRAESELNNYKAHLEEVVLERTEELQENIIELKNTQDELVESKKMAYLGSLVAGVAHKLNTPIGIGITSVTHLRSKSLKLHKEFSLNQLKKSSLMDYLLESKEALDLINSNLNKAADIITVFKQVAVDEIEDKKDRVNLSELVHGVVNRIISPIKGFNFDINIFCPDTIYLDTSPEILITIFTNLIRNSLEHGLKDLMYGSINIIVNRDKDIINIKYYDSGHGISKEVIGRIFEPFFSTKKSNGNLGLGLNIVYNLVVNKLKGSIKCVNENDYTMFYIKLSVNK